MMKEATIPTIPILFILFSMLDVVADEKRAEQPSQWKAGVATVVITPEQEIWMAGYGGRVHYIRQANRGVAAARNAGPKPCPHTSPTTANFSPAGLSF